MELNNLSHIAEEAMKFNITGSGTTDSEVHGDKGEGYSTFVTSFLYIAPFIGFLANILVLVICCKSWAVSGRLATTLVVSLTVSDLLVCFIVMIVDCFFNEWNQNEPSDSKFLARVCVIKYFLTTLACGSSSYNICAIAIDRYRFISQPLQYHALETPELARCALLAIWITTLASTMMSMYLQFILDLDWGPPMDLFTQRDIQIVSNSSTIKSMFCPEPQNRYSSFFESVTLFLIPAFVVCVLYTRICFIAYRSRQKTPRNSFGSYKGSLRGRGNLYIQRDILRSHFVKKKNVDIPEKSVVPDTSLERALPEVTISDVKVEPLKPNNSDGTVGTLEKETSTTHGSKSSDVDIVDMKFSDNLLKFDISATSVVPQTERKSWRDSLNEMKGYFVLVIIVGSYIICWMPYAIYTLLYVAGGPYDMDNRTSLLLLGMSNSIVNPVIYAGSNVMIRHAIYRGFNKLKKIIMKPCFDDD